MNIYQKIYKLDKKIKQNQQSNQVNINQLNTKVAALEAPK